MLTLIDTYVMKINIDQKIVNSFVQLICDKIKTNSF